MTDAVFQHQTNIVRITAWFAIWITAGLVTWFCAIMISLHGPLMISSRGMPMEQFASYMVVMVFAVIGFCTIMVMSFATKWAIPEEHQRVATIISLVSIVLVAVMPGQVLNIAGLVYHTWF